MTNTKNLKWGQLLKCSKKAKDKLDSYLLPNEVGIYVGKSKNPRLKNCIMVIVANTATPKCYHKSFWNYLGK